jgi:hypothetical protein
MLKMKVSVLISIIMAMLFAPKLVMSQNAQTANYISTEPLKQLLKYARFENKLVLEYTYSDAYECVEFEREILSDPQIAFRLKSAYVCGKVYRPLKDKKSTNRNATWSPKPYVVLYSNQMELRFNCKISSEKQLFLDQVEFFISANDVYQQMKDLVHTNGVSRKEALVQLGRAYAHIHYKRTPEATPFYFTYKYTLDLPELAAFSQAFISEWNERKRQFAVAKPK